MLAAGIVALAVVAGYRLYAPTITARPTEEAPPRRRIDLNRADRQELLQVPGLGTANADAILAYRAERGSFDSLDQLSQVHGFGPKTTEKVKVWLTVGAAENDQLERLERKPIPTAPSTALKGNKLAAGDDKLDLNGASEAELTKLPGIGATLAGRIVQYRSGKPFGTVEDLRQVKGIGAKTLEGLRPFVMVNAKTNQ